MVNEKEVVYQRYRTDRSMHGAARDQLQVERRRERGGGTDRMGKDIVQGSCYIRWWKHRR